MGCLIDYIGIRLSLNPGAYEAPPSGLYINSLPGISLESISKIATADQEDYKGVWADIQTEAELRFRLAFIAELLKCYKINKKVSYDAIICENIEILANAWRYLLGNQTMLFRLHTNRLNRYTTIDLKDAATMLDHYQVEFETALAQAVLLIDVEEYELSCGGNPEYVLFLP